MQNYVRYLSITAIIIGLILIIVALRRPPLPVEVIKIGGLAPLTGDATSYGFPIQRAFEIARDEINEKGGVNGKKLEIIWENGKCEAKASTDAVQKLINIDKVEIILGGVCSSETLAAAPLTEEAKVLLFSPSATSPDITDAGDFVFRLAPSDALAGKIAASYASLKFNVKRAAIISENKDYAQGLRNVFKEEFRRLGGTVVADEVFLSGETNFKPFILKIKEKNPEVVYIVPQTPSPGILILKEISKQGLKTKLLTAEVLMGRDIVKENFKDMEGLVGIEPFFNEKGEKAASFLAKYKEKFKEEPPFPFFMSSSYDILYLLKDALEEGNETPESIRDFLYDLKDWQGAIGKVTIDKNGDLVADYSIKEVKNGELRELEIFRVE